MIGYRKELKHTMDHLTHLHPDRYFHYYYYFDHEDVNRNFLYDGSRTQSDRRNASD